MYRKCYLFDIDRWYKFLTPSFRAKLNAPNIRYNPGRFG
jgi:hypothetical protein